MVPLGKGRPSTWLPGTEYHFVELKIQNTGLHHGESQHPPNYI